MPILKPDKEYTGRATIRMYNCDCMELMKTGKKWDLAIVDPPYGIGVSRQENSKRGKLGSHYKKAGWDDRPASLEYFDLLFTISKNQIVWGANHFISRIKKDSSCWLVWNKKTVGNTADCELAWTSFDTAVRCYDYMWEGYWQEDMKNKQRRIHPTEKPIQLYKWLLTNYAKEGDTIFDSHGGSMSIAIACWEVGFDLDICELDKDYFDAAVKRFENHISQQTLF